MKQNLIITCNKCSNAQAEQNSKYCRKCNNKKKVKEMGVNKILQKFGFRLT